MVHGLLRLAIVIMIHGLLRLALVTMVRSLCKPIPVMITIVCTPIPVIVGAIVIRSWSDDCDRIVIWHRPRILTPKKNT